MRRPALTFLSYFSPAGATVSALPVIRSVIGIGVAVVFSGIPAFGQAGTWATKAPMPTTRAGSVSGVINGQIYVVNGNGSNGASLGTNEVYDPPGDTWSARAPNPVPSPYAVAGVINGKLYVAGGCGPADDCRGHDQ